MQALDGRIVGGNRCIELSLRISATVLWPLAQAIIGQIRVSGRVELNVADALIDQRGYLEANNRRDGEHQIETRWIELVGETRLVGDLPVKHGAGYGASSPVVGRASGQKSRLMSGDAADLLQFAAHHSRQAGSGLVPLAAAPRA